MTGETQGVCCTTMVEQAHTQARLGPTGVLELRLAAEWPAVRSRRVASRSLWCGVQDS